MSSSAGDGLTYEKAGVVGLGKDKSAKHFEIVKQTHVFAGNRRFIETPFGNLYEVGGGMFQSKNCDGLGTKVLIAELAGKHDTVGIDAVATVTNDCIRTGARPIAFTNIIDARAPTPELVGELMKGIVEGAKQSLCPIVGGETACLSETLNCEYIINCDCVGEVEEKKVIRGERLEEGDAIIGLRSSGVHMNAITLVRKALFKKWGGKYDAWEKPDGFDKELVMEVLTPANIYVKQFLELIRKVEVKAALHVTGDAYKKFEVFGKQNPQAGFRIENFSPQPIFGLIQQAGDISDEEMFKRFNMGWGFAVVVDKQLADDALQQLGKNAEKIGEVTANQKIIVEHEGRKIVMD